MKMEFIFIGLLLHVSLWPALKIRAIPALLGLHYSAWTHQRWSEKHWEANTTSILNSPTGGIQGDRQSWPLRNVNLQSLPQDPYIPPRQFPSPKSGTAGPRHLQGLLLALTPLSVRANKTEAPPPPPSHFVQSVVMGIEYFCLCCLLPGWGTSIKVE